MSSIKEEKSQAAADKIKAAALSAAKGLSRAQAERAAAAAARNVNAYGQKEEGPSRWQERKEAKRQMYLMSTEKAVRLGERKDLKANMLSVGGVASQCQKCFQTGHWTYECKNERVYISRPSRSQLLKNPKLRQKLAASYIDDNPEIEDNDVEEREGKNYKRKEKSKRKYRSHSESSDSEASHSDSDSRSSSASGSECSSDSGSSYSSSSDSEDEKRRRRRSSNKKQKGRHKRYSSSSESSSDTDSSSYSDSAKNRSKKNKNNRRH